MTVWKDQKIFSNVHVAFRRSKANFSISTDMGCGTQKRKFRFRRRITQMCNAKWKAHRHVWETMVHSPTLILVSDCDMPTMLDGGFSHLNDPLHHERAFRVYEHTLTVQTSKTFGNLDVHSQLHAVNKNTDDNRYTDDCSSQVSVSGFVWCFKPCWCFLYVNEGKESQASESDPKQETITHIDLLFSPSWMPKRFRMKNAIWTVIEMITVRCREIAYHWIGRTLIER